MKYQPPTKMSNVNNLTEDERLFIWKQINLLLKDNPSFPQQLEKLAAIKNEKPIKWQLGLKALGV
jgi:hypothetical protein